MAHVRIKLLIAATLLVGAVTYLALAGVKKGWVYYLDVDTFLADAQYHQQRVRLCGRVAENDLDIRRADLTAQFVLLGPTKSIGVSFRGAVPDAFKAGADVVVEGQVDSAGLFQADVLMTKCASKYQAEEHAKRLEKQP